MSKARDIADLDFNSPDIDGGNIDGATIGGTTPAAGSFTTLNTTGDIGASGDVTSTATEPTFTVICSDNSLIANQYIGGFKFQKTDPSGAGAGVLGGIRMRAEDSVGANAFMQFSTGWSGGMDEERARFTSEGSFLVGTTSARPAEFSHPDGFSVRADVKGQIQNTVTNAQNAILNRDGSDGQLLLLRREGTEVGNIRSISSDSIAIGTGDAGLRFVNDTNRIQPVDMDSGLNSDALTSLGDTNKRFKDFHMSGKANIGSITTDNANTQFNKISRTGAPALYIQQGDNTNDILQLRAGNGQAGTGSQHVTVTGSGNLLIGKTANNLTSDGIVLRGDGELFVTRANDVATFNRRVSDGDIIRFSRDATTRGSIGVQGSRPYFGNNINFSIKCDDFGGGGLVPANQSGTPTNNVSDIGGPSAVWNDLYLGGGVYLGGTGAANKLDDYEEGTFDPIVENGTYTYHQRRGHYVKIGNMVYVHIGFRINTATSVGTSVGQISGLPFTSAFYGSYREPHARIEVGGLLVTANLGQNLTFYVDNSSTRLLARTTANNADTPANSSSIWQNGTFIKLTVFYTVS